MRGRERMVILCQEKVGALARYSCLSSSNSRTPVGTILAALLEAAGNPYSDRTRRVKPTCPSRKRSFLVQVSLLL